METWTFDWAIRNLIAELLMPPGIWILLLSIAFLFFRKLPKLKISLVLLSLVMMWVTSTSIFSKWLIDSTTFFMDWPKPVLIKSLSTLTQNIQNENPVQAIIVLGGGRRLGAKVNNSSISLLKKNKFFNITKLTNFHLEEFEITRDLI